MRAVVVSGSTPCGIRLLTSFWRSTRATEPRPGCSLQRSSQASPHWNDRGAGTSRRGSLGDTPTGTSAESNATCTRQRELADDRPFRIERGAQIDRTRPVHFTFDGRSLTGFAGDTLASALLGAGVRVVGRGMKFHRPRGILTAGMEEPNALVTIGTGAHRETCVRATMQPLYEGLEATSQNCWPSLSFDIGRLNDALHPLFPAGFYNKTFIWPSWHTFEPAIRRIAGLGSRAGR